jgi:acyl-CoA synthetase (AMP-forming)/AMP-acid ligase II
MLGYLDDPEATAAALTPDGWLRSGDVGWLDAAGNLTITDRLTDMYIVGGFNCYPAEIERELGGYPGVMHCAVVGVPDERLGEVGRAFIVPAPGAKLTEAEIVAWCRANFANYKAPRSVRFVEALPTNATGKVLKHLLQAGDEASTSG